MNSRIPSVESVSRLLYETDPMGTCCRENACYDEYDRVAAALVEWLAEGEPVHVALRQALCDGFGSDLLATARLEEAQAALRTRLERGGG